MPEWTAVTGYLVGFAALGVIYAVLAVGLNIQWGYTGLFNIGIAGFTAVGAYTSALLTSPPASSEYVQYVGGLSLPFPVGLVGAAVFCGLLAFLVGIPTLRLREDYLAIVTIGIAEVLRQVLVNERWLANGTRGLIGIPQPLRGLVPSHLYDYLYLGLGALVLVAIYLALERAIRSPWGRVLKAIREDETAALAAGKDTFRFRLQAFIVGAMVMGIGGALYTHFIAALTPDSFQPLFGTFLVWAMLLLGGAGNNKGAMLGAFLVWGIWSGTGFLTDFLPATLQAQAFYIRYLFIALLLEGVLLLRPQGILGEERVVSLFLGKGEGPRDGGPPPTGTQSGR